MSEYHQQAHLEAQVDTVWDLVGNPKRYPEWWPNVVEVRGERFEEGDRYVQVTRSMGKGVESTFLIEGQEDLREISMRCQLTGMYARWRLTEAQGGTFVDLEMGMDPLRLSDRVFDAMAGRLYFRRWSDQSVSALRQATAGR
jgi:ribosome-associated toxin RatA of RatAB toxin-antitoxin module